ncbi:MAG: LamG domain-containing protein [Bdellovibrionales bacterium]
MGLLNRRLYFLAIALALVLGFQNCSNGRNIRFSENTSPQSGNDKTPPPPNQDGYLGKPKGDFVRTYPEFRCDGAGSVQANLQGWLKMDGVLPSITEDNCLDMSYSFPLSDSRLDILPYNPDYVGFDGAIYAKVKDAVSLYPAVESFCRVVDEQSGLDVVAELQSQDARVRTYQGVRQPAGWLSGGTNNFIAQRVLSVNTIRYAAENFVLTIDTSNAAVNLKPARLEALLSGRMVRKDLQCRVMRRQSALNYTPSAAGMIGLWQLNGNLLDQSGSGHNATLIDTDSTANFVPGRFDQAMNFDGREDRLSVAPAAALNNLPQLSVAGWIWVPDNGNGSTSGGSLVKKTNRALDMLGGWNFYIGASTRRLTFLAKFSTDYMIKVTQPILTLNTWQHVAATWRGTGRTEDVVIYVNGVVATEDGTLDALSARTSDAAYPLVFGDIGDVDYATYGGRMDQMSIWNRALTVSEIQNLYQNGVPLP